MFRALLFIILTFLKINCFFAQAASGQWTWQGGSNYTNYSGSYGTVAVSASSNAPPGLYEAAEWQDLQGNFWLYGGDRIGIPTDDLWKFDINTLQWVWLGGSKGQGSMIPKYGTLGIPSTTNSPGFRQTSATWVDLQGNFWLFGGLSYDTSGTSLADGYNDLWKYNPPNNTWTWMKGSKMNSGQAFYGIKGVENVANVPPRMSEMDLTWKDNLGDLWLMDNSACLWKYRIATNNWIWIKGDSIGSNPVYGIKGQSSILNNPGTTFMNFTRWKDSNGHFWYYDGLLWKYETQNNCWTWIWGDTTQNYNHFYGMQTCDSSNRKVNPLQRKETRACWIDDCDNLWMMGGWTGWKLGDLLFFSQKNKEWILALGDTIQNPISIYGTLHVSSPANKPSSRCGAIPFKDINGNLWLFGGESNSPAMGMNYYSDLWMFTPDTACTHCKSKPTNLVGIQVSEQNAASSVRIFPNPTNDFINIAIKDSRLEIKNCKVQITNYLGQMMLEKEIVLGDKTTSIGVNNLPEGVYSLTLKGPNSEAVSKRFMISH